MCLARTLELRIQKTTGIWSSWAKYVIDVDPERFAQFAVNVWGVQNNFHDPKETGLRGIEAWDEWCHSINLPTSLSELGIEPTDEQIHEMAQGAVDARGGDHAAKFATACAEMEKRKPDVTGDMADFLDGTFASGSDPSATPTPPNAFTAALGSGPNNFIARFTGYFHAEVEGTYSFKVYADDAGRLTLDGTNRVVNVAAGTKDAAGEVRPP